MQSLCACSLVALISFNSTGFSFGLGDSLVVTVESSLLFKLFFYCSESCEYENRVFLLD